MTQEKHTELTNAAYKLAEFFPEEDPLKNKVKEKALQILENLVLTYLTDNPKQTIGSKAKAAGQASKDIEVLKSYLNLAKKLGWLDNMNSMILFKEYDQIRLEIKPLAELAQKEPENVKEISLKAPVDNSVNNTERQSRILEILRNQEKAQVSDLQKVLTNVTKRTIRRDLDDLLKKGEVIRVGEFNQVFYKLYKQSALAEENQQKVDMLTFEA